MIKVFASYAHRILHIVDGAFDQDGRVRTKDTRSPPGGHFEVMK